MMHTRPMKTSISLGQERKSAQFCRCSDGGTRHRVIRNTAKVSEPAIFGHCLSSTVLGCEWYKLSYLCLPTFQAQLAGTNVGRPLPKAAPLNSRVSRFHGLDGDDFRLDHACVNTPLPSFFATAQHCCRHPLDQQNTRLLKVLPGLEGMAKNILGKIRHSLVRAKSSLRHMCFDILLSAASIGTPCC